MHPHGVHRILSALPEGQLRSFEFEFQNAGNMDRQSRLSDPVTGENTQTYVAKFSNLDRLTLHGASTEETFENIQAVLSSWKPMKAQSRHLELHLAWPRIQSILLSGDDTSDLEQNTSVLEESCEFGSVSSLPIHGVPAMVHN